MFHKFLAFVLFITLAFAFDNPTNWWAGSGASRGDQQQVNNFAAFNVRKFLKEESKRKRKKKNQFKILLLDYYCF